MEILAEMAKLPISVVMLTLNEEVNLPGALENLLDFVEVVYIVDSLSSDGTVDIALESGARIIQRPFTNFGDQWNFALDNLPIDTPWTLKMDPDERLSDSLKEDIRKAIAEGHHSKDGYWIERRLWFMGEPLNLKQWVLRLWKTGSCHFSDVIVNEVPIVEGEDARLRGLMEHFDSPDLHHWFEKQNRYSTMESIMRVQNAPLATPPRFLGNEAERRSYLKKIFYRVPFRYFLIWCYHALWQRAYFSGAAGRAWVRLRVEMYYRTVAFKVSEMEKSGRIPDIPKAPHGDYDSRVIDGALHRSVFGDPN